MEPIVQRRHRRWGLRCFFWCCWIFVAVSVAVVLLIGYVNQIGFPEFFRRPLLEQLRENNLASDISRLRWRFHRGLVADRLHFRRLGTAGGEELNVREAQLLLDWSKAGWASWPEVRGLFLSGGELRIPLESGNALTTNILIVSELNARLRFISPELWELDDLHGRCLGAAFEAAGSLTNASRLRSARSNLVLDSTWKEDLREFVAWRKLVQFTDVPSLAFAFHLDLLDWEAATADLRLQGKGFFSSQTQVGPFRIDIGLNQPPGTNGSLAVVVQATVTNVATPWGGAESVKLDFDIDQTLTQVRPQRVRWTAAIRGPSGALFRAKNIRAEGLTEVRSDGLYETPFTALFDQPVSSWGRAAQLTADIRFRHRFGPSVEDWIPEGAQVRWGAKGLDTQWGTAATATIEGEVRPAEGRPSASTWSSRDSWLAHASIRAGDIVTKQRRPIPLAQLDGGLDWRNETLVWTNASIRYQNETILHAATLHVPTRKIQMMVDGRFRVPEIARTWGPPLEAWVEGLQWPDNPSVSFGFFASARLPDFNAALSPTEFWTALNPSLRVHGVLSSGPFHVRGLAIDSLTLPFAQTNGMWTISEARLKGSQGSLEVTGKADTREFAATVRSSLELRPLAAALIPEASRWTQQLEFGTPPEIEGRVEGKWSDWTQLTVGAHLDLRDVGFRGEHADALRAEVRWTNGWLRAGPIWARKGTNTVVSEGLAYGVDDGRLFFTNTVTTIAPDGVMSALGPKTARTFEPFEFPVPPQVMMNGVIPTRDTRSGADVRFDVHASSFRWRFLAASNLTASLWWRDGTIILTNLVAGFHGGRISGNLSADVIDTNDTTFRFDAVVADSQIRSLLNDISPQTNHIEGWLSGRLTVFEGHSQTNGSWRGAGTARLRDGFLWDLPLFGGVSKILERAIPGLGQTRFKSGTATFILTNHAVVTSDLELRSPTVRLQLAGQVGFDTQLEGRLVASVLENVPLLGPLLNFVFKPVEKLLEYDVKGPLNKPEMELRYIPEFLLAPLHPVETLRELLPGEKNKASAPPK